MAKKEFTYRGKTLEELQKMSLNELQLLLPAPARRKIKNGFTDQEKILLKNLKTNTKRVKTHQRTMIILPEMVGKVVAIHTGKEFVDVELVADMIGHRLGEFTLTRKKIAHNAPGIAAPKKS